MKVSEVLNEQNQQVMVYHGDYSMNEGGIEWDKQPDEDNNYQEAVAWAQDEYGTKGRELNTGVWVGWNFDEAQIEEEADEDGPYMHQELTGSVAIVSYGEVPDQVLDQISDAMNQDAEAQMEDEMEAYRDQKEYDRDVYAYHGVRRSDFY